MSLVVFVLLLILNPQCYWLVLCFVSNPIENIVQLLHPTAAIKNLFQLLKCLYCKEILYRISECEISMLALQGIFNLVIKHNM